ncbi:transposase [Synechococcus sp. CBW1006]|uniref:transposase n=1 Tax=Synechococcus sp. CBW1006 TaxID=1353138 RepID=UPI00351C5008
MIPELARYGLQQLIELEVAAVLGAERHERSEERLGYRNGYRPRTLATQVGDIDLRIPKLRSGSHLPSILEPRRRVDQALYGVVMEAYVGGQGRLKVRPACPWRPCRGLVCSRDQPLSNAPDRCSRC